jgi:hypothetical protein
VAAAPRLARVVMVEYASVPGLRRGDEASVAEQARSPRHKGSGCAFAHRALRSKRKRRRNAYWEDRYHATPVESGEHVRRCLVYVDLDMVRAGVSGSVSLQVEWYEKANLAAYQ